jgi:acyl carrier protein
MVRKKPSGSDAEDLVIEVEDTFGFSIPDRDCEFLDTVGKLYDYILQHRFKAKPVGCVTNVAFYKLRKALMTVFGISRTDVQLSLDLARLVPTPRRKRWSELQHALGLRLPQLVRPLWVTVFATVIGFSLVAGAYLLFSKTLGGFAIWIGLPVVVCIVPYVLYHVTEPLATRLCSEFTTVGGLTKSILRKNYGALSDQCQRANPAEIWSTLCALIGEELGVDPNQLTPETNFVKDLNVD